jgi:hypothetical protein
MTDCIAGILKPVIARRPEDGAADAAAGPEAFIGGIYDRVCVKLGNADLFDLNGTHDYPPLESFQEIELYTEAVYTG